MDELKAVEETYGARYVKVFDEARRLEETAGIGVADLEALFRAGFTLRPPDNCAGGDWTLKVPFHLLYRLIRSNVSGLGRRKNNG